MRAIVDRWVTPVAVILAAASVVFAATWTMTSRFGGTDEFSGRNAPRTAQGPVGRLGAATQAGAIGAPTGSSPARQAPIGAAGATAPGIAPTTGSAPATGDAAAAPRPRDGGRQGARVPGGEDADADRTSGERTSGERSGRSRERR